MESVRKKHEETRDPIVAQLRNMVDTIKRKDESREPQFRQLGAAVPALQSAVTQMQNNQQKLEETIKQSFVGYDFLLVRSSAFSRYFGFQARGTPPGVSPAGFVRSLSRVCGG